MYREQALRVVAIFSLPNRQIKDKYKFTNAVPTINWAVRKYDSSNYVLILIRTPTYERLFHFVRSKNSALNGWKVK